MMQYAYQYCYLFLKWQWNYENVTLGAPDLYPQRYLHDVICINDLKREACNDELVDFFAIYSMFMARYSQQQFGGMT